MALIKKSGSFRLAGILSAFVLTVFLGAPGLAAAPTKERGSLPDKNTQHMTYEVFAGGINAVSAGLDVTYESKTRYRMTLSAETKGLLGSLVPWRGTFETIGWRGKNGHEMPEMHKSTARGRGDDDVETKEYKYTKEGHFSGLTVKEAGRDKSPGKIDDKLTQGTTDALTATLAIMNKVAGGAPCEGSSEVFDGMRRFSLIFKQQGEERLETTRYNSFEGPALRCEVEVRPVAGAWHEKPRGWMSIQEQGRELGSLPVIWLARIDKNGPAVPVKMRVKTDYGTLFVHLVNYQSADKDGKLATRSASVALADNAQPALAGTTLP